MFKKLKLPALLLGAALALMTPTAARAEHHHRHWGVYFGVGPAYPTYYANGYYDRWGYWHPYGYYSYGYYDRWGRWHRR